MAKRKSNLGKPLAFVAAVLGLVAVVMLFLPAIGIKDTDTTYTGLQITFGCKESLLGFEYTVFDFSFMNLLTYILAVVGIVFSVLSAVGKGSKFAAFIAARWPRVFIPPATAAKPNSASMSGQRTPRTLTATWICATTRMIWKTETAW